MTLFKILKVIGIVVIGSVATLVLLPWLVAAGNLIVISFTDKTDWRIEDYMCTLRGGCDEFIAERKRAREQKQTKSPPISN
jgi:hypothetical protein